jgi:hypothetical protein
VHVDVPWTLLRGGQVVLQGDRVAGQAAGLLGHSQRQQRVAPAVLKVEGALDFDVLKKVRFIAKKIIGSKKGYFAIFGFEYYVNISAPIQQLQLQNCFQSN